MELLLAITLIGLGIYNYKLLNRIKDQQQQISSYHEACMSMARELTKLGSPNVEITDDGFNYNVKE